jgi:acyl-CoA reductase-like NAD-dependent aldehyde dehydrogenase
MSNQSETITSLGLLQHYDLFINGEFVPSTNPQSKCTSKSPVDGTTLSTFADTTKEDVDKTVEELGKLLKIEKKNSKTKK